jgi:hypothetical protein
MGGPPGFGAPQKKSGPPVALMVGGGCGLLAVIGVIVLVIALASGGGSEASASEDDDKPTSGDDKPATDDGVANAMDGAQFKRIPSTNVEIPVPPGWREDRRSLYSFALSGDGDAILAFTTVSSLGEFAGRIQHATKVFSITDCTMKDAVRVNIGPNKLRSRLKEGVCTFNGVRANVATVLVESGRRAHPLVIYAVDVSASKVTVEQAQQTVLRMREN